MAANRVGIVVGSRATLVVDTGLITSGNPPPPPEPPASLTPNAPNNADVFTRETVEAGETEGAS